MIGLLTFLTDPQYRPRVERPIAVRPNLKSLFQKAVSEGLSAPEKDMLTGIVSRASHISSILPSTRYDINTLAHQINKLSKSIITENMGELEATAWTRYYLNNPLITHPSMQPALAKLILGMDRFQVGFARPLAAFTSEHSRAPTPEELKSLIAAYNADSFPKPERAGTTAMQVGTMKIYYNSEGHLEIGSNVADRILRASSSSAEKNNIGFTPSDVANITKIYNQISKSTPYNNMGLLLDFMGFYRENKASNPTLTLKEAFTSFKPSPLALYDKYGSGTCVILSFKIMDTLDKAGYVSEPVGQTGENNWNTLPVVSLTKHMGIKWEKNLKESSQVGHVCVAIKYTDREDNKDALLLEVGFDSDRIWKYTSTEAESGWRQLHSLHGDTIDFRALTTPDALLKKRITANFKVINESSPDSDSLMGLDLLQGNFYLNSRGAEGIEGLPKNKAGKISIPLEGIASPAATGVYVINGREISLTHREALHLIIEKISGKFHLPADTEDNIVTLSERLPEFFATIALEPLPLLKAHYPQIQELNKKYQDMQSVFQWYVDLGDRENFILKEGPYNTCKAAVAQLEKALQENSSELLTESLTTFFAASEEFFKDPF